MSDLEKRFNAHISTGEGVAGVSVYADTLEELLETEARYVEKNPDMRIRYVEEGYADEYDHFPNGPGSDPIIEYRRRSTRVVPESEYRSDPVKWLDEEVAS